MPTSASNKPYSNVPHDFDAVKVFKGDDGKAIFSEPYIEHVPPDVAAIRLWLFNRSPDRWRDKIEVTQTGRLSDLPSIEIKKRLVAKMIEWGLVPRENVPPELLPPDGTLATAID